MNFDNINILLTNVDNLIKLHKTLLELFDCNNKWLNLKWNDIKCDEMIKENGRLLNIAKTYKSLYNKNEMIEEFLSITSKYDF